MRVSLTLDGSPSAIAAFLATVPESLTGAAGAALTAVPMPIPMPTTNDEDDGPADSAAPSTDATGLPWDERIQQVGPTVEARLKGEVV